jgi:serine/threonine protein kinase
LGEGGFAKAVGAYDISTERVICLKVFRKDRLKDDCTEETLLNELDVYKRIVSSMPCPAANFIMGLELSFQTQDKICFAMVCPFSGEPSQLFDSIGHL